MAKIQTMADRIRDRAGEDNPNEIARKLQKAGLGISHQAVRKWLSGGDVEEAKLEVFCSVYGTTPAYIRYGVGNEKARTEGQKAAADLVSELPQEIVQQTFDFMGYQLAKADALIASEKLSKYFEMIDKIKRDRERKGKE